MTKQISEQELQELRESGSPTVFATVDRWAFERYDVSDSNVWTLSENPLEEGWETDSAYDGYGLPKLVAERYARAINALPKLLAMIDELKK